MTVLTRGGRIVSMPWDTEHLKRSHRRILTTHTGSLPRPTDLLEIMASQVGPEARARRVRSAVAEVVQKQADAGVNIVSDGEMSKSSFVHYVKERVQGFEGVAQGAVERLRV